MYMCVCVRERERERGREIANAADIADDDAYIATAANVDESTISYINFAAIDDIVDVDATDFAIDDDLDLVAANGAAPPESHKNATVHEAPIVDCRSPQMNCPCRSSSSFLLDPVVI